mgnify:CR=1 FL=1
MSSIASFTKEEYGWQLLEMWDVKMKINRNFHAALNSLRKSFSANLIGNCLPYKERT